MEKEIKSILHAGMVLKAIEDIFENSYDYNGRSYAVGVCNKVRFIEKGISLITIKNILKNLEEMKLVKKTPLKLKNAPLELQMLVIPKKRKSKNSRGHLLSPIYICHPDKLNEYRDIVARQIKGRI